MPDTGDHAAPLARSDTGANTVAPSGPGVLRPILLAFPVAFYSAALLSDITFLRTSVVQWSNFSQWLIAGADVFAGLLLALAILALLFGKARGANGRRVPYLIVVAVMFVLGVINAFKHSQDGWASVGTMGVLLSALCTILALIAAYLLHSTATHQERRP